MYYLNAARAGPPSGAPHTQAKGTWLPLAAQLVRF
jgi:hypothetical protein